MLGLVYLIWLSLGKLKLRYHGNQPSRPEVRRWRRYAVDLPVRVIVPNEPEPRTMILARGTELSRGGMALCVDLSLRRNDAIEVEFQTPSRLLVTGIVRNRTDHCFGVEFLAPLPS